IRQWQSNQTFDPPSGDPASASVDRDAVDADTAVPNTVPPTSYYVEGTASAGSLHERTSTSTSSSSPQSAAGGALLDIPCQAWGGGGPGGGRPGRPGVGRARRRQLRERLLREPPGRPQGFRRHVADLPRRPGGRTGADPPAVPERERSRRHHGRRSRLRGTVG